MTLELKNKYYYKLNICKSRVLISLKSFCEYFVFCLINILFDKNYSNILTGKLLIINKERLGDLILATDFINSILVSNKYSEVFLLAAGEYDKLLEDSFPKLKIIPCNFLKYKFDLFYKVEILSFLQKQNFDEVINISPERGIINDEISIMARGKKIIGLKNTSPFIPQILIKCLNKYYSSFLNPETINQYSILSELLKRLSIKLQNTETVLHTDFSVAELPDEIFIAVAPLASHNYKSWPVKNYYDLCARISSYFCIVLLGTKEQYPLLEEIKSGNDRIINTAGKFNVSELPGIIMGSQLFIGNDSGLTHMALQLKKKMIGIIGGGSFYEFFPYKENSQSIYKYHKMDCFNCKWNCIYTEPYCMNNISSDEVFMDIKKLLRID